MPQFTPGELKSGAYFITSCATNLPIARKFVEDKQVVEDLYNQTVPKPIRVVTLPEDSHDLAWDLQEVEPKIFILRSRGVPTNAVEEGVGACIVYSPSPTLWRVRQAVESGENAYFITTVDGKKGWWASGEEPGTVVEVRPLPHAANTTDLLTGSVNHLFRLTPIR